jgi:hypothetical protein
VVNRLFRAVTPLFAEISAKIALVRVQGMISLNDRLIVTRKSFFTDPYYYARLSQGLECVAFLKIGHPASCCAFGVL